MSYKWTQAAAYRPPVFEPTQWVRCSRALPCPICQRPDWCRISDDSSTATCMRISDGAEREVVLSHGIGYVHRIGESRPIASYVPPPSMRRRKLDLDCGSVLDRWAAQTSQEDLANFAAELGVDIEALQRLDVVWSPKHRAWAFPMHNDRRGVIGIRIRGDSGKWAVKHSDSGLFMPHALNSRSSLVICEGPTDTAAALTLGYQAAGRPSNTGGIEFICDMLQVGRRRDVVIMADADGPGRHGANILADRIVGLVRTVKIVTPPEPNKDLRQWLQRGATKCEVDRKIDKVLYHRGCGNVTM